MPGKCKFKESWLSKVIYEDWLSKEFQDIHSARCKACCKSIKLQTMGEAALTSHAGGSGHKAAVRKMREADNVMNNAAQTNSSVKWVLSDGGDPGSKAYPIGTEDSKEQVALCLQRDPLDGIMSSDWSNLNQSPTTNSASHNAAELQDVTFPTAFLTAPGTSQVVSQRLHPTAGSEAEGVTRRSSRHKPTDLSRQEHQERADALEQQQRADTLEQQQRADTLEQQMKVLEWENRMKVLAWEQELVMEKRRAVRQKEKAFRMKKTYYRAKLKRMGEDVPPSSTSSSDEEAKTYGPSG